MYVDEPSYSPMSSGDWLVFLAGVFVGIIGMCIASAFI